jgi:hypothetical protein
MRKVLLGLVAAVTLGAACFAPLSQASAQWGIYIGNGGYYGGGHRSFYGGHTRGHYDYHPGSYVRHGYHYDYVPGHYDYHRGSHGHGHGHGHGLGHGGW